MHDIIDTVHVYGLSLQYAAVSTCQLMKAIVRTAYGLPQVLLIVKQNDKNRGEEK